MPLAHNSITSDVEVAFRHDSARIHLTLIFKTTTYAITLDPKDLPDAKAWLRRAKTLVASPFVGMGIGMHKSTIDHLAKALDWFLVQADQVK